MRFFGFDFYIIFVVQKAQLLEQIAGIISTLIRQATYRPFLDEVVFINGCVWIVGRHIQVTVIGGIRQQMERNDLIPPNYQQRTYHFTARGKNLVEVSQSQLELPGIRLGDRSQIKFLGALGVIRYKNTAVPAWQADYLKSKVAHRFNNNRSCVFAILLLQILAGSHNHVIWEATICMNQLRLFDFRRNGGKISLDFFDCF